MIETIEDHAFLQLPQPFVVDLLEVYLLEDDKYYSGKLSKIYDRFHRIEYGNGDVEVLILEARHGGSAMQTRFKLLLYTAYHHHLIKIFHQKCSNYF